MHLKTCICDREESSEDWWVNPNEIYICIPLNTRRKALGLSDISLISISPISPGLYILDIFIQHNTYIHTINKCRNTNIKYARLFNCGADVGGTGGPSSRYRAPHPRPTAQEQALARSLAAPTQRGPEPSPGGSPCTTNP